MVAEWDGLQEEYIEFPGVRLSETRIYQEIEERKGRSIREAFVAMQLTKKFGELPEPVKAQLATMPSDKLESLAVALLDFQGLDDLEAWLANEGTSG